MESGIDAQDVHGKPHGLFDSRGNPVVLTPAPFIRPIDKVLLFICALNSFGLIMLSLSDWLSRHPHGGH